MIGPGRSGSTFLYRILDSQPAFTAPEIKEGCYYRSRRRLERARRGIRGDGAPRVLLDAANHAWRDRTLPERVEALCAQGCRTLLVMLLREHAQRARSMVAFRRSRGAPQALLGRRAVERAVVRDRLLARDVSRVLGIGTDVLIVEFSALTRRTRTVLDVLSTLCNTPGLTWDGSRRGMNEAVVARSMWLSAAGKLAAVALRAVRCRRLLQRLKDEPKLARMFFRPRREGERGDEPAGIGTHSEDLLRIEFEACLRLVERRCESPAEGIWLARRHRAAG